MAKVETANRLSLNKQFKIKWVKMQYLVAVISSRFTYRQVLHDFLGLYRIGLRLTPDV